MISGACIKYPSNSLTICGRFRSNTWKVVRCRHLTLNTIQFCLISMSLSRWWYWSKVMVVGGGCLSLIKFGIHMMHSRKWIWKTFLIPLNNYSLEHVTNVYGMALVAIVITFKMFFSDMSNKVAAITFEVRIPWLIVHVGICWFIYDNKSYCIRCYLWRNVFCFSPWKMRENTYSGGNGSMSKICPRALV